MTPPSISYTLHTAAWPTLPIGEEGILEELLVDTSYGYSVTFEWVALDVYRYPNGALRIRAFSDSFGVLLDPRILDLLGELRRKRERNRDISPQALILMLENRGARPSAYHLQHAKR